MPTRSVIRSTAPFGLLAAAGLLAGSTGLLVAAATPARADQRVIEIDFGGPTPATLRIERGDTIAFRNTDPAFPHTVAARSTNWSFSATINPGQVFEVPGALTAAGTYVYGSNSSLEDYEGEVILPGAAGTPTRKPSAPPSARPTSSATPTSSPDEAGRATTPPLFGEPPSGPSESPSGGPTPETAPEPLDTPSSAPEEERSNALASGDLGQPPTPRAYGLPAAVATVGAAGTASLLVRFLLAQPAGRREDGPLVTLDDPA